MLQKLSFSLLCPGGVDGDLFNSADVVVLMASSLTSCGIAWGNAPNYAIAVVAKVFAMEHYNLALRDNDILMRNFS